MLLWAITLGFLGWVAWRVLGPAKERPSRAARPGPGTVGTIYDMLNEDQRRAVEIIVEGKAEARRPEYPDGNLPDLEKK